MTDYYFFPGLCYGKLVLSHYENLYGSPSSLIAISQEVGDTDYNGKEDVFIYNFPQHQPYKIWALSNLCSERKALTECKLQTELPLCSYMRWYRLAK